jgi:hypothetical protein
LCGGNTALAKRAWRLTGRGDVAVARRKVTVTFHRWIKTKHNQGGAHAHN